MARPPSDVERRLIAAARDLMPRVGLAGLTVRAVSARAGVNPGLFHYHFGSREAFGRRVLEEVYGGFFRELEVVVDGQPGRSCRERLRRVIMAIARFEREHRSFSISLVRDILNGEGEAVRFLRRILPAHLRRLHAVIRECQGAGVIRRMPVPAVMIILLGAASGPAFSVGFMERAAAGAKGEAVLADTLGRVILSDRALEERIDVALRGLRPERERAA